MDEFEIVNTLWERIDECLKDEDNLRCLRRLVTNANMLTAMMEANDILTEGKKALYAIQDRNKKINMATHDRMVDNVLVFVFLKALTTLPTTTKAYKLGLIDKDGRLKRQPKTQAEHDCISNLDLLMFRVRKWLSSKMQYLTTVSWLKGFGQDTRVQNYFSNVDTVSRQYMIRRVNGDLEKILGKD